MRDSLSYFSGRARAAKSIADRRAQESPLDGNAGLLGAEPPPGVPTMISGENGTQVTGNHPQARIEAALGQVEKALSRMEGSAGIDGARDIRTHMNAIREIVASGPTRKAEGDESTEIEGDDASCGSMETELGAMGG